jgi:nitrite reductase/ring-hydroxylating ferredoxin subunit
MSNTSPRFRHVLASTALAAGVAIGLAVNAGAQPAGDDFWQCAADHQDTDGIGVCCVFYGGDYDERSGECLIDDEAQLEEANTGPSVPPKHPVLTRVDRLPMYAMS